MNLRSFFHERTWEGWNLVIEKPLITISVIILMGLKDKTVARNASTKGSVSKGSGDSTGLEAKPVTF